MYRRFKLVSLKQMLKPLNLQILRSSNHVLTGNRKCKIQCNLNDSTGSNHWPCRLLQKKKGHVILFIFLKYNLKAWKEMGFVRNKTPCSVIVEHAKNLFNYFT